MFTATGIVTDNRQALDNEEALENQTGQGSIRDRPDPDDGNCISASRLEMHDYFLH